MNIKFHSYPEKKPRQGQSVIWVWASAGQLQAGYFLGNNPHTDQDDTEEGLDANLLPTHWFSFPGNWPKGKAK